MSSLSLLHFLLLSFSASISFLSLRVLILRLGRRFLDIPNSRSSHLRPTPRGGGIVFVVITTAFCLILLLLGQPSTSTSIPLLALPLSVIGFLDDRFNLPASWRFGVQLLTSALILSISPLVVGSASAIFSSGLLLLIVIILLMIVITAVINFTNFMDGLDGLVAGCMAVTFMSIALLQDMPLSLFVLFGSLLGFLFFNWCPAQVFMGDVGSTFLGAVFAGLVLQASTWSDAFCYLLLATPLLADACFCVLRRAFAGHRVFQAHRLHLFQRLHQAGWSHSVVSLSYILSTLVLSFAMYFGGFPWLLVFAATQLLVGIWLDQRVAVPFVEASGN